MQLLFSQSEPPPPTAERDEGRKAAIGEPNLGGIPTSNPDTAFHVDVPLDQEVEKLLVELT